MTTRPADPRGSPAERNIMKTLTKPAETHPVATTKPADGDYIAPRVDIVETKDEYILEADMPGVSKDGLEVLLDGSDLVIVGRRSAEPAPGDLLFRESRLANYRRVFELDPTIDTSKISANIHQGVLTLHLPKAEEVKPRRIEVR